MLSHQEKLQREWGGRASTIDQWLKDRQALLITFCALARPEKKSATELTESAMVNFCNQLMDYLSAGHFEIYDMLTSDDKAGLRLRQQVYPELAVTTDQALAFNDKYSEFDASCYADDLTSALDKLGEMLETRFALEDKLIRHMLEKHGAPQIEKAQQSQAES
ncbi:Rsd/AlgQ family anti-sigma factor [Salinimonas chungwhensis]|uniref:Rsd/AlgQ family anti-sigma factor n=1 Tax=Salinimonas chungwhensis TaxID=265425 RepID=UPI00035D31A9|nr:Rsd/AlgQ family anti-sigma factor [Salinimonas chungwhensis]